MADDAPALLNALVLLRDAATLADAENAAAQTLRRIAEPARRSALVRESARAG